MQALWERVHAHPEDEEARRVLADALQQAGDARGEFIELQCALARLPEDERDAEEWKLADRAAALLDAHGDAWVRGWPYQLLPTFVRGFPERQVAPAADFARGAERAFRIAPTLRELSLSDEDPVRWASGFSELCASPHASRLKSLELPVTFGPGDFQPLCKLAPTRLTFRGGTLGEVAPLKSFPLEELVLDFDVGLGASDLTPLAALPMRVFVSRGNRLVAMPAWPGLEKLVLDRAELRVDPRYWPKLKWLELRGMRLGRPELRALLEAGHPTVRRLGLQAQPLEPELFALLAHWPALEVLDVRESTMKPGAWKQFHEHPLVRRLRRRLGP